METRATRGDGSAVADVPLVQISRHGAERYRWRCPNGHVDWDRTNQHVFCLSCSRQSEHGADVNPEHWSILDAKTGEEIPWSRVQVEG